MKNRTGLSPSPSATDSSMAIRRCRRSGQVLRSVRSRIAHAAGKQGFAVETKSGCELCTVFVHGEVDLDTAPVITAVGLRVLNARSSRGLTIDLTDATFMDAAGLAMLVRLRARAEEVGTQFQLIHLPDRIRQLIAMTGLTTVLPVRVGG